MYPAVHATSVFRQRFYRIYTSQLFHHFAEALKNQNCLWGPVLFFYQRFRLVENFLLSAIGDQGIFIIRIPFKNILADPLVLTAFSLLRASICQFPGKCDFIESAIEIYNREELLRISNLLILPSRIGKMLLTVKNRSIASMSSALSDHSQLFMFSQAALKFLQISASIEASISSIIKSRQIPFGIFFLFFLTLYHQIITRFRPDVFPIYSFLSARSMIASRSDLKSYSSTPAVIVIWIVCPSNSIGRL